jgi:hypothetical protein
MTHWVLFVAPLVLASFVLLFAFVGCTLDSTGTGAPEKYSTDITTHPNVVSYWRLGEASGTTAADSKGGNAGTYVGGVTLGQPGLVVGDTNTAAEFDGTSGYVSVPRADDSLSPLAFTVEALVSLDGGEGEFRAVVSSRNIDATNTFGYILYASDLGNWEAWVGDGTPTWQIASGPPATDGGHFLAMTYDGTDLKLYVDPAEDAPITLPASYAPNTAQEFRIGAGANEAATPLYFFPGRIDDVAVYNAALDFDTIRAHFALAWTGSSL